MGREDGKVGGAWIKGVREGLGREGGKGIGKGVNNWDSDRGRATV